MEHAQRDNGFKFEWHNNMWSLNPYFNGTCSKRRYETDKYNERCKVLILILMEHAQRVIGVFVMHIYIIKGLNPYFNGTCSKRYT